MNTDITLQKGCESWLYQTKKGTVKKGTFTRLLTSLKMMEGYPISKVLLSDIRTDDIQRYVNALSDDGYAVTTIKKQFNLISGYLRYLVGEGAPVRAAYLNVRLPLETEVKLKKKNVAAYTKPEQKKLCKVCDETHNAGSAAVILMIELGLRIGEVLALQWSDVLWERRAIYIHRTAVNHHSRAETYMQESPKSKSSNRTLPLSAKALSLLERLSDEADSLDGLIFVLDGQSVGYPALRTQITHLCDAAGVTYRGMHVFRHTFATNCYYRGVDIKRLSQFLGHGSVSVTYNTYIHLFGDKVEELRCVVE